MRPAVTIWFHQALDVVDESGGSAALERRFAREVGMRVTRLPRYPGSATSWQAHTLRGTTPFVVELHAGALSALELRRFVSALRPAGADTVVARVDAQGGRIGASLLLPGTFTIPAVAYDGSASGLSGDGHTLVLIEPRASFPRAETRLAVLHTRPLLWRTTITLPGDFSFDAVSPDGSSLYLIQYTSALDPTKYNVRVYDLDSSRLIKAPIVDPHERGEKMRGQPLTRAASPDGRWAYTLYDGAGKTPFVHALDTSNRTARCIDLDALAGTDLTRLGLKLDARHGLLIVTREARPALNVDLASFQVRSPSTGTSGFPWLLATVLALGVLIIAAVLPSRILFGRRASGSGSSSPHRAA